MVVLNLSKDAVKAKTWTPDIFGTATEAFTNQTEELKRGKEFDLKPWAYLVYEYK
ncbi:MAG TPA: hypothetical protein VHP12_08060 [Chitinophagaceae bacterium]|nr:hypothetical protein [Chitinophagaceae bacterium]